MSRAAEQQVACTVTREARGRVPGDGIELSFGFWPGRGSPVVALHGLTASYVNFIGVAERLAGRRPLFALDLRGRGDSDKPEGPYGLVQHARDVAEAMRAMGLGRSVVVGHSMGAFIATALATQNPELVAGLILIDGGYLLDMSNGLGSPRGQQEGGRDMSAGVDEAQVLDTMLVERITQLRDTYASREIYREFWRARPHFPADEWGPWTEAFLNYEVGGEPPHLQPKASEAAVRADVAESFEKAAIAARLKSVRTPVLLLRAASGFTPSQLQLLPEPALEQMRTLVPQLEEETIPGTTHYTIVLGERGASRIADLIDEFSRRCNPTDNPDE